MSLQMPSAKKRIHLSLYIAHRQRRNENKGARKGIDSFLIISNAACVAKREVV